MRFNFIPKCSGFSQNENRSKSTTFGTKGLNVAYIAFNTEKAPFDNVKVRQALNYAVDKKAIIEAVYQGAGTSAKTHFLQQFGVIMMKSKIIRTIQKKQNNF